MGISIDLHIYNKYELLKGLSEWGTTDTALSIKILESCGTFFGDNYVLLNNEYHEDGNPYYNVAKLFDSAFKKEDSFHVFCFKVESVEGKNWVEVDDIAAELGFEIIEEEE